MGLINRLFKSSHASPSGGIAQGIGSAVATSPPPTPEIASLSGIAVTLGGDETLYVVGESHRQDVLWSLVGGLREDEVREPCVAELVPEPENEHDRNAIKVTIQGRHVGYLSREDAAVYLPGVQRLIAKEGCVALHGVIVGGGHRPDGLGRLGVFLDHDPSDFGIEVTTPSHAMIADVPTSYGGFRTGLSSARATDRQDDRYDLSWIDSLSPIIPTAIQQLKKLLPTAVDPIDQHYMFVELEERLYACRDAFTSALDEYDTVCRQHDAAMDEIRTALLSKFGRLPILDTYRQVCVRCQKSRDWEGVRHWAARGLSLYGADAARGEAVEDLRKRLGHAQAKLESATRSRPHQPRPQAAGAGLRPSVPVMETLICLTCGRSFERIRTQGRKPHQCPACRGTE